MHMEAIPSAIEAFEEILSVLGPSKPVVFLDFDGTLAPIVPTPDQARMSDAMHQRVEALSRLCTTAVISGRGLPDVQRRVGIESIAYAGSHGFEIRTAGGEIVEHGAQFLPELERAESELRLRLGELEGVIVERKKFSIAVHYRQVAAHDMPRVKKCVDQVLSEFQGIRAIAGKKIFDLQPAMEWHKGRAVRWLRGALEFPKEKHGSGPPTPLYIGDDTTDEDAFEEIREDGVGIVVQESPAPSAARYRLRNTDEVEAFLGLLIEALKS